MGKFPRRVFSTRALGSCKRSTLAAFRSALSFTSCIETLEKRQHLSATAFSRAALSKFDSTLAYAYQNEARSTGEIVGSAARSIQLEAVANVGYRAKLVAALKMLGSANIVVEGRAVDALVPVSKLRTLATLKSLQFASAASGVINTGSVTSQGDTADIAAAARAAYNISGTGVTIGILSDSFNNNVNKSLSDTYSTDVASGDLPANVQILSDNTPGTDEGRALAQVIYDSAPGATLKFATAQGGQATMASNILALANSGCKIIVDDFTYPTEPMFEDGIVAQAVESVIARGITYISSAGNFASQSFGGNWHAGSSYTTGTITKDPAAVSAPSTVYTGTSFNFAGTGSGNDTDSFQLGPAKSINLSVQWDSPYKSANSSSGATTQLDAYILNSAGTMIEAGSAALVTGKDPIQQFTFTNPSTTATNTYQLLIVDESAATPDYVKFVDLDNQATNWQFTAAGTDASTIFGHANAAGVIAVGAVNYASTPAFGVNPPVLESFSSSGGTPLYYNTSNTKYTSPIVRQEPIVDGPDDLTTTFYGTMINGVYSYGGTSAAAASVAGVAALLLSINPSLSPAQVSSALGQTAINIGSAPNFLAGYGLVQTKPAVAISVGNVTGTVFSDNNDDTVPETGEPGIAGVTVYLDLNHDGKQDPGDPTVTTDANGSFTFYNQATGSNIVVRAVQPSGYIATFGSQTISISGAATTSNVNLGFFPDNYTGASLNYTVQRNAGNTSILNILVGGTLTYSAPLASVPSLSFNLSGGSSSVTVNTTNGNPIPSGGVSYAATGTNNSLILNGTSSSDTANINYPTTNFDGSLLEVGGVQNQIINGAGGNDTFTISGSPPATDALTFNGGLGNDSLTVNAPLPNNGLGTTFNAGTGATEQNTLNVNAGTFTFTGDPAALSSNLTVNVATTTGLNSSGGTITLYGNVIFAAGPGTGINQRNLAALNIAAGCAVQLAAPASHTSRAVLVTSTLSVATTAVLDLSGNDLIVNSGAVAAIAPLLATGYNNGLWTGKGIQSTAAAANITHLTALGYFQNNTTGSPLYTAANQFDGVTPTPAAILIKYTYYGDANLDGKVDGIDYSRLDTAYLDNLTTWSNGDFNYDGTVNGSDYTLIDNAYNTQGQIL
jgi:hypothetical protein